MQFKQIISSTGDVFQIPSDHSIFTIPIFKLIELSNPLPFSSECLSFMIYDKYEKFTFHTLLSHIKYIFQFSFEIHEKKCLKRLFDILIEEGNEIGCSYNFIYSFQMKEIVQSVSKKINIAQFAKITRLCAMDYEGGRRE